MRSLYREESAPVRSHPLDKSVSVREVCPVSSRLQEWWRVGAFWEGGVAFVKTKAFRARFVGLMKGVNLGKVLLASLGAEAVAVGTWTSFR